MSSDCYLSQHPSFSYKLLMFAVTNYHSFVIIQFVFVLFHRAVMQIYPALSVPKAPTNGTIQLSVLSGKNTDAYLYLRRGRSTGA